jgi:hypothetical protein
MSIIENAYDQMSPTGRIGECDICHDEPIETFYLCEDVPGDWEHCEPCALKIIRRREARAQHDETAHIKASEA